MRHFLLFILLIPFSKNTQSQVNLVDTNKIWHVEECFFSECGTVVFSFGSDTLIGSTIYKKFNVNTLYAMYGYPFPYPVAAREDTVAKRVYFYRNNTEYLAYDFSLNTNDTISLNDNGCILTVRIMNTDSIILDNGEKRKRLFLDIGSEWIEGIGSTFGLNYPIFFWCAYDVSSLLSCFEENDTLKYTSPFLSQCFNYTVGIDHIKNNPLIVSPNPFSDFTILKSKIDFLGTDKIMLLGIDGRLIKTFDNQFGNEFKLSREGIENGIYILRIMRNDLCIASIRVLID